MPSIRLCQTAGKQLDFTISLGLQSPGRHVVPCSGSHVTFYNAQDAALLVRPLLARSPLLGLFPFL